MYTYFLRGMHVFMGVQFRDHAIQQNVLVHLRYKTTLSYQCSTLLTWKNEIVRFLRLRVI